MYKPFRSFFCSVPKIIFEFLSHQYGISTNLSELIRNFYISYYIFRQIRHIFLNKFTQFAIFNTSFSSGLSQNFRRNLSKINVLLAWNEITFCTMNRGIDTYGVIGGGGKGSEVKKVYFLLFTSYVSQKHLGQ